MRTLFVRSFAPLTSFLVLGAAAFACGDSSDAAPPAAGPDASDESTIGPVGDDDGGSDATDPSSVYPAPHNPIPPLQYGGSALVKAAKLVSVTFDGDPSRATIDAFDEYIVTSPFWTAVTSEYCEGDGSTACIGSGALVQKVKLPVTKAAFSSQEIETFIQDNVTSGVFPPPTPDTIYSLHFKPDMQIGDPGFMGCQTFDGYHSQMVIQPPAIIPDAGAGDAGDDGGADAGDASDDAGADAGTVPPPPLPDVVAAQYSVTVQCAQDPVQNEQELTLATEHEYVETVTDPAGAGYIMPDPAWQTTFLAEVGDLCDYETPITVDGYTMQRIWSNASAKAGHNPCIPLGTNEIYFNAAPKKGQVSLAVNASTTVDVEAWSEAPTGSWTIEALDWTGYTHQGLASLTFELDTTNVTNGTVAKLKITLAARPQATTFNPQGFAPYVIASHKNGVTHYYPGLVLPK